jgi:predicted glutamine amidotransferase
MCKLAGWTSSKESPLKKEAADRAIIAAAKVIRITERDGFGFAQHGTTGLRSRFMTPADFTEMDAIPNMYKRTGKAAAAFAVTYRTAHEGVYKPHGSMIVHGRTATCGINLENVHPFRRQGWTLAHNGVISWGGKAAPAHDKVTCDSQHLIIAMADNATLDARKADMRKINGYAAFLATDPRGNLTAAVDAQASLYAGVTSRQRWIFGTTAAIVNAIADAFGAKNVTPYKMDDWTWLEFKQGQSEPELSEWKHGDANKKQMGFASKSLGSGWEDSTYRKKKASTSYGSHYSGGYTSYGYSTPTQRPLLSAAEAAELKEADLTEEQVLAEIEEQEKAANLAEAFPDWDRS